MCLVACFLRMKCLPGQPQCVRCTGAIGLEMQLFLKERESLRVRVGMGAWHRVAGGLIWGDRTQKYFLGRIEESGKGRACK